MFKYSWINTWEWNAWVIWQVFYVFMKLPNYLPHRLYYFIFPLAVYENQSSSMSLSIFSVWGAPFCVIFSAQLCKFKYQTDIRGKNVTHSQRTLDLSNQSKSLPYYLPKQVCGLILSAISLMKWPPTLSEGPIFKIPNFHGPEESSPRPAWGTRLLRQANQPCFSSPFPTRPNFHFPSNSHSLYQSISLFNFALRKTVPDSFINIHLYIFTYLGHSTGKQNSQSTEKIYSPTSALS